MLLSKSSLCSDWHENSSLEIVRVVRKRADVGGYYRLLGVEPDADERELKRAGRRILLEMHPDRGGDEGEFAKALEAYHALTDPSARAAYDALDDAPSISVRRPAAFVPDMEGGGEPIWYKEPADLLGDEDVLAVRKWHALVLDAARGFRRSFEIKVGMCRCPSGYYRKSDIALIGHGTEPKRWAAMCFVLMIMCERI